MIFHCHLFHLSGTLKSSRTRGPATEFCEVILSSWRVCPFCGPKKAAQFYFSVLQLIIIIHCTHSPVGIHPFQIDFCMPTKPTPGERAKNVSVPCRHALACITVNIHIDNSNVFTGSWSDYIRNEEIKVGSHTHTHTHTHMHSVIFLREE